MKLSFIPSIIAFAASALIAFGLYSWCHCENMQLLITIFGGISLLLTVGATFALSTQNSRSTVNIKVASGIFALLLLISNAIFCVLTAFSMASYVIINGVLLLAWFIIMYAIAKAYQNMS